MKFILVAILLIITAMGFEASYEQTQSTTIRQNRNTTLMGQSGTGTPGGSSGQIQINNSGAFGGIPSIFSNGTTNQWGIECTHQSITSVDVAALGSTTGGEITLQTGIVAGTRFEQITLSETTQFTGTFSALTVSLGRPGGNNTELTMGLFSIMISTGNVNNWTTRPIPPQLTTTYSIVASFISTGANLSTASAGLLDVEFCAYKAR